MFILKIKEVNANSIYNTDVSYVIMQPEYSYSIQRGDEFRFDVVNDETSIAHPLTDFKFVVTNVYYGTAMQPGNIIISFRVVSNMTDPISTPVENDIGPQADIAQIEDDQSAE